MPHTVRTSGIHGILIVDDLTVTPDGVRTGDDIIEVTDDQLQTLRKAAFAFRVPLFVETVDSTEKG